MIRAAGIRIGEYSLIWFKLLGTQIDKWNMFVLESYHELHELDQIRNLEKNHTVMSGLKSCDILLCLQELLCQAGVDLFVAQIEKKIARVDKSHCNEF